MGLRFYSGDGGAEWSPVEGRNLEEWGKGDGNGVREWRWVMSRNYEIW